MAIQPLSPAQKRGLNSMLGQFGFRKGAGSNLPYRLDTTTTVVKDENGKESVPLGSTQPERNWYGQPRIKLYQANIVNVVRQTGLPYQSVHDRVFLHEAGHNLTVDNGFTFVNGDDHVSNAKNERIALIQEFLANLAALRTADRTGQAVQTYLSLHMWGGAYGSSYAIPALLYRQAANETFAGRGDEFIERYKQLAPYYYWYWGIPMKNTYTSLIGEYAAPMGLTARQLETRLVDNNNKANNAYANWLQGSGYVTA